MHEGADEVETVCREEGDCDLAEGCVCPEKSIGEFMFSMEFRGKERCLLRKVLPSFHVVRDSQVYCVSCTPGRDDITKTK